MIVRRWPAGLPFGLRRGLVKGFLLGCAIALAPITRTVSPAAALEPGITPSVPCVAIMFNWTGFHVGTNIGRSWSQANMTGALHRVSFGAGNQSVFVGGSQISYNDQIGPTVILGTEWLIDGVGGDPNALIPALGDRFEAFAREDFVTTLTGRVGFTAPGWDRWLVYVKGGVGWAETQAVVTDLGTGAPVSTTDINGGWVAGLGLEWAFAPSWTARLERQSLGLSGIFQLPDGQPSHPTPSRPMAHGFASNMFGGDAVNAGMLSVGANYQSNWSPNPASVKY
jgi:outer membrane immunogenic protein